jgi:hypothetical protein
VAEIRLPWSALTGPRYRLALIASLTGFGAVVALSIQEYFARHWGGGPIHLQSMLLAQTISAFLWIVLTPFVIVPLARQLPPSPRNVAIHMGAAATIAIVHLLLLAVLLAYYYYGWSPLAIRDIFRDRMHTGYVRQVFIYLLIVATIVIQRQWREREPAAETAEPAGYLRRVLVKSDGRVLLVPAEEIDWIEAQDNNVVLHVGTSRHSVRGTLAALGGRLDPAQFARAHRSAIVNVGRVREIQTWFHGELVAILKDETRVTIGRSYRDQFMAALEG